MNTGPPHVGPKSCLMSLQRADVMLPRRLLKPHEKVKNITALLQSIYEAAETKQLLTDGQCVN